MSQKYDNISDCILMETQLQSEQKWLELALKLIAKERNSLEIERLELRSRLSQLNNEGADSANERTASNGIDTSVALKSAVNMMQNMASLKSRSQVLQQEITDKANSIEETMKNEEELNLTAANSYLTEKNQQSEDEEDELDLVIDMNMLMNGDK